MSCPLTQGFSLDCKDAIGGIKSVRFASLSDWETLDASVDASGVVTFGSASQVFYKYELDKEESSSKLLYANSFDLLSTNFWQQIKEDYELVQNTIRTKGFEELTGKMGKFIQPRTKGTGHGSTTRAFYARISFVETILGVREIC